MINYIKFIFFTVKAFPLIAVAEKIKKKIYPNEIIKREGNIPQKNIIINKISCT